MLSGASCLIAADAACGLSMTPQVGKINNPILLMANSQSFSTDRKGKVKGAESQGS